MSVSDQDVSQLYTGNGVTTSFPIVFVYQDVGQVEVVQITISDDTRVDLVQDTDYTIVGSNIVITPAPSALYQILVKRSTPLTQDFDFLNDGAPFPEDFEDALDRIVMQVQETADVASRALVLGEGATTSGELPPPTTAGQLLAVNAAADGFEWVDADAVGVPAGGIEGSVLAKLSVTDGDTDWVPFGYSGYSARFSESISTVNLDETLTAILDLTYLGPQATLSASGGTTVREKGTAVTSSTLTAAITKRSDPIDEVRFYLNPSTLLDTQTSGGGIPSGGNSTYNWTGSFSDNTTFRAEVDDSGATGGPTTVTATTTFTFVYPYYTGAGAAGLTGAQIALLTKLTQVSTATVNRTTTVNGSQKIYFAYLASYGDLTSILDVNGFETLPDWTKSTKSIVGLDTTSQSYTCYEFNNTPVAGDYYYSFRR